MNAFTQSCDPSPDMEEVWKRSLIRVTGEFTLPPVVLRMNDAIIGTLGNFSVSTGKAKAKKTFNVCALVAAALINGQVLEYRASFPETSATSSISTPNKPISLPARHAAHLTLGWTSS